MLELDFICFLYNTSSSFVPKGVSRLSFTKIIILGSFVLFGAIATLSYFKKPQTEKQLSKIQDEKIEEIAIESVESEPVYEVCQETALNHEDEKLPFADRIDQFFTLNSSKFPIVETVTYTSRVPWLTGRPAWIADYASHYSTSRHFIARSLNKTPDYFTQNISPGKKFNVLKKDLDIEFYLVIDISRCKMLFYYLDLTKNERVLVKTYNVGLGRKDSSKESNSLTPYGKYKLGDKIAIYKPGIKGYFQDQKIEMITVFGTRWIPFDQEISGCTQEARGLGIHGAPWVIDPDTNEYIEQKEPIGSYDSDGCIRLASEDIEELFSIIITKPTTIELVENFFEADLPLNEASSDL